VAFAVLAFTSLATANETAVKSGGHSVCENASWIFYNTSETEAATVTFDIGPWGYNWGKKMTRVIAPGGYQAGAIAMRTDFWNKGPGVIVVNCQRQRFDRHDWKIDPGSQKTYQTNYHMDHVQPGTYIEPGLGQPEGTERGIWGVTGSKSELHR
ncbi:MAG: hypothetical protein V3T82_06730, partial [Nitrospinaceae bacterium]